MRYRPGVPQIAPRRAVELLTRLHLEGEIPIPGSPKEREAVGTLLALGAVAVSQSKSVSLVASSLVDADGNIDPTVLRRLLSSVPGGPEGLALLQADGQAAPRSVGEVIANATNSKWSEQTTHGVGGSFRAWAKLAGLEIKHPARRAKHRR
jgi:hypothetical protein